MQESFGLAFRIKIRRRPMFRIQLSEQGVEREGALIEGKYETDVIMSILDREYEAIKGSFSIH